MWYSDHLELAWLQPRRKTFRRSNLGDSEHSMDVDWEFKPDGFL